MAKLPYDREQLIEVLLGSTCEITYFDIEASMNKTRRMTLEFNKIRELNCHPIGFADAEEAATYIDGAIQAVDVEEKDWHTFYIDQAIRMSIL